MSKTTAVKSRQELLDWLRRGARPRENWGIGLESEKLVVDAVSGRAASFARIQQLLQQLEGTAGWVGIYAGENLIGLQGKRSSVTLEPGGQMELSGRLCCDLHCNRRDLKRYVDQVRQVAERLQLRLLGFGIQPFSRLDEIDWLPKDRYGIMGPYMRKTGDMGQRMMKQTAGTQVNLDYLDEQDCVRKLRLLQWLSPLFYALFANSPLLEGAVSGCLSLRGEIWSRTDRDRCGLIEAFQSENASLSDYVDYAMAVPLYFLQRGDRLIDMTPQRVSFGQFLTQGAAGLEATLADWDLHLSTLFPDVRLRPQLELRCPDSLPPDLALSVAALVKGLFYSADSLRRCEELLAQIKASERAQLYRDSWRFGLQAHCHAFSLRELAQQILPLADQGLCDQFDQGYVAADEREFLRPVQQLLAGGETLAEQVLNRWHGSDAQKLAGLTQLCSYDFV